jgi:hypothetical protein
MKEKHCLCQRALENPIARRFVLRKNSAGQIFLIFRFNPLTGGLNPDSRQGHPDFGQEFRDDAAAFFDAPESFSIPTCAG